MTATASPTSTTSMRCPTSSPTGRAWSGSTRSSGWSITSRAARGGRPEMRFGYWMPVFGGWLRNVDDERMDSTFAYNKKLARRSEQIGFDLTLIAELFLNDIKGISAPCLDAWSTAAALAAVTESLELMVAVRPTFHQPAVFAKQAANVGGTPTGGLPPTVVSWGGPDGARRYGVHFEQHDDRYERTAEWLTIVNGAWSEPAFSYTGKHYKVEGVI